MEIKYEFQPNVKTGFILKVLPHLLFPDLTKKVKQGLPPTLDTVLATIDGRPIGLICSVLSSDRNISKILTLFVIPEHRNKKVGTKLVEELLVGLKSSKIHKAYGYFRSHWKTNSELRKLLLNNGFGEPQLELSIISGKVSAFKGLYGRQKQLVLDKSTIVLWDLKSRYHDFEIHEIIKRDKISQTLNPFFNEETIYGRVSFIVLHDNRVVGWFIAHKISTETLEYTALYLAPSFRSYGMAIGIMKFATDLQFQEGKFENFAAMARNDNPVMNKFVKSLAEMEYISLIDTYKYEIDLN